MKKEAERWLQKAEEDYGTSSDCIKSKRHEAAAFYSQQAAEKALKAIQIQKLNKFDKVHDLLTLAKSVNAPDEINGYCIALSPYYTITRYPDVEENINERTAKELLAKCEKVLKWASKNLKR